MRIQECISSEFLMNPNIWHLKVPLVVYTTVEMHELDVVMQQFGFRQMIPPTPQDIEDLHHIDLRRRTDENWPTFHAEYINVWNHRRHDKPYLLVEETKGKQRYEKRPRWTLRHPRFGTDAALDPSSTPMQG
ncbi:hypothetical protein PVK06_048744 [Gossypium arboreum]|uniref:Serine/threonine-protein phosphatase 7 long form homolog n=1 Tax=Gossypium arboreum TaxID=29729 RepID=A0ABR0MHA5_GOSAR|nr:hypothetical protein PVK06_048744 [Gossypium arboreum]